MQNAIEIMKYLIIQVMYCIRKLSYKIKKEGVDEKNSYTVLWSC